MPDARRGTLAELARSHPTLLLTVGYLALTTVGLVYEAWLFRYFGINILEYSETGDFLLAAVRTPLIIILSMLPLVIMWAINELHRRARQRYRPYANWAKRIEGTGWDMDNPRIGLPVWALFVIIYASLFTQIYAKMVANQIKNGKGRVVNVELVNPGSLRAADTPLLIGTTGKFVFLYYPRLRQTRIVPIGNVASIGVAPRERR